MDMDILPEDWSVAQNSLFTRVYKFMTANMAAMTHPECPFLETQHWQTICHNAAFLAAELREADSLRIIDSETEQTIAESPGGLNS